jgi:protein phosphatase
MSNSEGTPVNLPAPGSSGRVQADLGGVSHRGCVRSNNEDHFLVMRFERSMRPLLTNLPAEDIPSQHEEIGYGMIVADGLGGAAAGEVASRRAIAILVDLLLHTPDWIMGGGAPRVERVLERMAERYRQIDAALTEQGNTDPSLAGMGTTMTLAFSLGPDLVLAHIGDSRAYLLRGGQLYQLTRDHTFTQQLLAAGILRPEEVATHQFRHVLMRVLGGGAGQVEAECQSLTLEDGDQLLLCTDGLTNMVEDAAIGEVLQGAESADKACQTLLGLALAHGGLDNVTVVVARYRFAPAP